MKLNIVCPSCYSSLLRTKDGSLNCTGCSAVYPKRSKVDVFLSEEEWSDFNAATEISTGTSLYNADNLEKYILARRESPLNVMYYDDWIRRMFKEVSEDNRGPLLELMCGGADICRRLPSRYKSAIALDFNVRILERAFDDFEETGEQRVKLVCGNCKRLPVMDESVGIVMIQGGLHHVKAILDEILSEIRRVLKPNGLLVATEPANDNWLIRKIRHWQYSRSTLQGHDAEEDGFTREELAGTLSSFGLHLDSYRRFGYIAYPLMGNTDLIPLLSKTRLRGIGFLLMGLDRILESIPGVRKLGWISVFRAIKQEKSEKKSSKYNSSCLP